MSAAGRGPRLGGKDDFYETPSWCVDRLLEASALPVHGLWYEPAAGDGAIVDAVNRMEAKGYVPPTWAGMEIRPEAAVFKEEGFVCGDFLSSAPNVDPTVVITNPPFSLAIEFYQVARDLFPNSYLVLLLRLPWLASKDRCATLRADMPDVFVLPDRPSFTGRGTDATDYAWMVWSQAKKRSGRIMVLESTPLEQRRRKP